METGNGKEVIEKVMSSPHSCERVIIQYILNSFFMRVKEMAELAYRRGNIGERSPKTVADLRRVIAPSCDTLTVKVRPLPCLAAKEADTTNNGPQQPFCYIFSYPRNDRRVRQAP